MSLICETIVSEDESRAEEELDYEEEEVVNKEDKDEGELESGEEDEDLEEGEVKEDSEDDQTNNVTNQSHQDAPDSASGTPSGQNRAQTSICRFYGRGQCTWGNNCRFVHPQGQNPPKRSQMAPLTPMNPGMGRRGREQVYGGAGEGESAWERGLKQAKEALVRANRRKEEDEEFEEKRFNLSQSRESPQGEQRYDVNSDEYERRRRLAFESAPWNNQEPIRAPNQAENYRDPWRRSKSPKREPRKRSREGSMSSISGSSEENSSFSSSRSESEFSSSESNSQNKRKRFQKFEKLEKKEQKIKNPQTGFPPRDPNHASQSRPDNAYDSWSESLSESESDVTSFYSTDGQSDDEKAGRVRKGTKGAEPSKKRAKGVTPPTAKEESKKSPIKMTFLKKQNLMKKENKVFNGIQREDIEEEEEELKEEVSPSGEKSLLATVSRREELLQQLKAVEDAIARKRSKIN